MSESEKRAPNAQSIDVQYIAGFEQGIERIDQLLLEVDGIAEKKLESIAESMKRTVSRLFQEIDREMIVESRPNRPHSRVTIVEERPNRPHSSVTDSWVVNNWLGMVCIPISLVGLFFSVGSIHGNAQSVFAIVANAALAGYWISLVINSAITKRNR